MTANGGLEVSGRYKAYGQDLTITRGNLTWNYNAVSDPRINIRAERRIGDVTRSEEHTSELQSQSNLVCRLLLEKKKRSNRELYKGETHPESMLTYSTNS